MPGGPDEPAIATPIQNRFDRMEVAGAFGDLGTLVPFVVAYIGVLKMDPFGVLLAFSLAMIVCGFVYRTPIPVQPMKAAGAIATTQAAQTLVLTPQWSTAQVLRPDLCGSFSASLEPPATLRTLSPGRSSWALSLASDSHS